MDKKGGNIFNKCARGHTEIENAFDHSCFISEHPLCFHAADKHNNENLRFGVLGRFFQGQCNSIYSQLFRLC
jgi:hypothetical protein